MEKIQIRVCYILTAANYLFARFSDKGGSEMKEIINSFGVLANFFPFNLINNRWGWTFVVFAIAYWLMLKFYEYRERRK